MQVREEQVPSAGGNAPQKLKEGLATSVTASGTRVRQAQSRAGPGKPGKPGLGVRLFLLLTPAHEGNGKSMPLL